MRTELKTAGRKTGGYHQSAREFHCDYPAGVTNDDLLELLVATAGAVERAVRRVGGSERRGRTERGGQYAIDLVADAAALEVLGRAPLAVLSEESGWSGPSDAALTVVLDPVDGSTNASRHIPYWATSLCVVDGEGP